MHIEMVIRIKTESRECWHHFVQTGLRKAAAAAADTVVIISLQ